MDTHAAAAPTDLLAGLRVEARDTPESGIVEAVNYGRARYGEDPDFIRLWVGEGITISSPTPTVMRRVSRIACMPELVTKHRSGPISVPNVRDM